MESIFQAYVGRSVDQVGSILTTDRLLPQGLTKTIEPLLDTDDGTATRAW
jgi:hypothetical protein